MTQDTICLGCIFGDLCNVVLSDAELERGECMDYLDDGKDHIEYLAERRK